VEPYSLSGIYGELKILDLGTRNSTPQKFGQVTEIRRICACMSSFTLCVSIENTLCSNRPSKA
jgi:hypothetical protein